MAFIWSDKKESELQKLNVSWYHIEPENAEKNVFIFKTEWIEDYRLKNNDTKWPKVILQILL